MTAIETAQEAAQKYALLLEEQTEAEDKLRRATHEANQAWNRADAAWLALHNGTPFASELQMKVDAGLLDSTGIY